MAKTSYYIGIDFFNHINLGFGGSVYKRSVRE